MTPRPHLAKLVERVRLRPALPTAVVFPADQDSLQFALSGAFAGYLAPTLVGPEQRIRDEANRAGLDIARLPIAGTPDDPQRAAEHAVALARAGKVRALVRGSLGVEALLAPIVAPDSGLRTGRRLSHAHYLDIPGQARPLIVTDAMLNVAPNLAAKKDIVYNAIVLAHALGIAEPLVALAAARSLVTPKFPSTSEAAALKSMAGQGAFPLAVIDGPMTPDIALSPTVAQQSGARTPIAGRADVLVAPSMEPAVLLVRSLTSLTGALAAGLVLGASVPIIVPGTHDTMETRIASCVLAALASAAAEEAAEKKPQAVAA